MKIIEVNACVVHIIRTDESKMPYRRSENSAQKIVMWEELDLNVAYDEGNWYTHDKEAADELELAYQEWLRAEKENSVIDPILNLEDIKWV